MNINDLEICEAVESGNQIIGGRVRTSAKVKAKARPGNAFVKGNSKAFGKETSTKAKTYAETSPYYGLAYGIAYGVARTGRKISVDADAAADAAAKKPY